MEANLNKELIPALALTLVPGAPASCTAEVRALQPGSFADGADWAPAGAPQLPTLLNGYAVRPTWKVAGVDYAVGVPIGTALKDPTIAANLPTGVSVDTINHMIRVAASNVTLNGYDFGLAGGWGIYIEPGVNNTVIQNCNFLVGSNNQVPINAVGGAGSLTVQYNTINGGGGQRDAVWALVNDNGSGTFIAQYNNFLNAPCDAIDFGEAAIAPTIEYNVFYNLGTAPESHPDPVQYIGDVVNNALEQFNTIYQPQGGGEVSGEEGVQVAAYGGSTITNAVIRNNVIIAKGPALTMSYSIAVIQSPGNTINGVVVGSNYIDYRGAYGPFYPPSGSNLTFTGNVDLATGTQILSPSGTASRAPSTCCPWDDERRDGVSNKRNRVSASLQ